jgi:hypothetical protein
MVYESGSSGDAKCLRYKIIVFVKRNIVLEACTDSRRSKTAMRLAKRNFHSFTLAERRPRISALVTSLPRCYPSPRVLFLNSFFELIPSAHTGRINPRHLFSHPLDIFLAFTLPQYYPLQFSGKNTLPLASLDLSTVFSFEHGAPKLDAIRSPLLAFLQERHPCDFALLFFKPSFTAKSTPILPRYDPLMEAILTNNMSASGRKDLDCDITTAHRATICVYRGVSPSAKL